MQAAQERAQKAIKPLRDAWNDPKGTIKKIIKEKEGVRHPKLKRMASRQIPSETKPGIFTRTQKWA